MKEKKSINIRPRLNLFRSKIQWDYKRVFMGQKASIAMLLKAFSALRKGITGNVRASKRLPLKLHIESTNICNFNCKMCDRKSLEKIRGKLNSNLEFNKISELIHEIKPLHILLQGYGEPLLYPDIDKLLVLCKKKSITVSITTNGSLLTDRVLDLLLQFPPRILEFSLNGATPKIFEDITSVSQFEKCITNLETFLRKRNKNKTTVKVFCVLQKKNLME